MFLPDYHFLSEYYMSGSSHMWEPNQTTVNCSGKWCVSFMSWRRSRYWVTYLSTRWAWRGRYLWTCWPTCGASMSWWNLGESLLPWNDTRPAPILDLCVSLSGYRWRQGHLLVRMGSLGPSSWWRTFHQAAGDGRRRMHHTWIQPGMESCGGRLQSTR